MENIEVVGVLIAGIGLGLMGPGLLVAILTAIDPEGTARAARRANEEHAEELRRRGK